MYVRAKGREERQELITFLEDKGYQLDPAECRTKEQVLDDILPIDINPDEQKYRMIGNVTCAAAAVSSGKMMTTEEFNNFCKL